MVDFLPIPYLSKIIEIKKDFGQKSKKLKSKRIVTKKNSDPNGKILLRGKSSPSFNETFSVQSVIRKRYLIFFKISVAIF